MGEAFRLSIAQFEQMAAARIFGEDEHVELIEGVLYQRAPIGPLHSTIVNRLTHLFVELFGTRAIVAVQNPVELLPDSMPQPDLAGLRVLRIG